MTRVSVEKSQRESADFHEIRMVERGICKNPPDKPASNSSIANPIDFFNRHKASNEVDPKFISSLSGRNPVRSFAFIETRRFCSWGSNAMRARPRNALRAINVNP